MTKAIVLESKRVRMEPLNLEAIESIHRLHAIPEVAQYNTIGIPVNLAATQAVLKDRLDPTNPTQLGWVLYDQNHTFLGEVGLVMAPNRFQKGEVSYAIHPTHWNQGYATEALKRVIQFVFQECHLHRLEAGVAVTNHASIRVLEKAGMLREGRHRKILPLKNGWTDNYSYAILEEATGLENKYNPTEKEMNK